jgi:hypothetical protein
MLARCAACAGASSLTADSMVGDGDRTSRWPWLPSPSSLTDRGERRLVGDVWYPTRSKHRLILIDVPWSGALKKLEEAFRVVQHGLGRGEPSVWRKTHVVFASDSHR